MRILGIDYGVKRIGLALSDPLGMTARPLEVIAKGSYADDIRRLGAIVQEQSVSCIVLGLPYNMDGTEGKSAADVRHFAEKLRDGLDLPVEFVDERMTTMQADRMLVEEADASREKRKQVRDMLAASILLQSYLDMHR